MVEVGRDDKQLVEDVAKVAREGEQLDDEVGEEFLSELQEWLGLPAKRAKLESDQQT